MYTVVYACNDGYARLAGISLSSLLKNTPSEIQVYIFNDKISDSNIEKLNSLKDNFSNLKELNFINVDSAIDELKEYISGYDNALDKKSGGGYTAYARLLFEKFVPQNVDKILYLDCDTLVTGDISLLFTFDMRDFPIAMGYDCFTSKYLNIINFPKDSSYFNSGVFLVDTKKWKDEQANTEYQYIDLSAVDRESNSVTETQIITKNIAPSRAQQIVKDGDVLFGTTRPALKRVY